VRSRAIRLIRDPRLGVWLCVRHGEPFKIVRCDAPGAGHCQDGRPFSCSYDVIPCGECNQTLPGRQLKTSARHSWRQRALFSRDGLLLLFRMVPFACVSYKRVGWGGQGGAACAPDSSGARATREKLCPLGEGVCGRFGARGWGLWRGLWIAVERNFLRWKTREVYPQHIVLPGLMRMAFCEGFQPPGNR